MYNIDNIDHIIKEYAQGKSCRVLHAEYGIGRNTLLKYLKRYNIPRRKPGWPHLYWKSVGYPRESKYSFNKYYFDEIDTPNKAYWLGFLMADGSIMRHKESILGLRLKLQLRDIGCLKIFREHLDCNVPIAVYNNEVSITIYNQYLANSLIKHGCVPCKSLILEFPNHLDKQYYSHFIRGYFDGDGSILRNANNNQLIFEVVGTLDMIRNIQAILIEECDIPRNKIRQIDNIYALRYGGNQQVPKIGEYLYQNADVYLTRKKAKFWN